MICESSEMLRFLGDICL